MFHLAASAVLLTASVAMAAQSYRVDPVHSMIVFRAGHLNAGHVWGRFNDPTGTFTIDYDDPLKSRFDLQVPVANIDTNNDKRDGHLKTADFFDAEKFPTITFKSTKVTRLDDKTYEVTGDMTIHGVTRPVTVELRHLGAAKGMQGETRSGYETQFTIRRSEFGMDKMLNMVSDEILLIVAFEGVQQ